MKNLTYSYANITIIIHHTCFSIYNRVKTSDDNDVLYLGKQLITADKSITGVFEIKESTLSIADCAFKDCMNLEKIILPDSVQTIGNSAFSGCIGLKEIAMPQKLMALGAGAFLGCSLLKNIIVPEGVSRLERGVFKDCSSLTEIALPDTLHSISFDCFQNTEIMNEFQYRKEKTLYVGKWLICYRSDFEGELRIREGTVGIADRTGTAFDTPRKNLSSVIIPESMKYLGMDSFCNCTGLETVHLPEGIISLGQDAFRKCTSLKNIVVPKSVQNIEQWAFMDCESIESITFLNPQTKIVWPAITNRKDNRWIKIIADSHSEAEEYCRKYGEKYFLQFKQG